MEPASYQVAIAVGGGVPGREAALDLGAPVDRSQKCNKFNSTKGFEVDHMTLWRSPQPHFPSLKLTFANGLDRLQLYVRVAWGSFNFAEQRLQRGAIALKNLDAYRGVNQHCTGIGFGAVRDTRLHHYYVNFPDTDETTDAATGNELVKPVTKEIDVLHRGCSDDSDHCMVS